jgi:hypothetical protein
MSFTSLSKHFKIQVQFIQLRLKHAACKGMAVVYCMTGGNAAGDFHAFSTHSVYLNRTSLLITVKRRYKPTIFY